jgi:hypothetical protein
MGFKMLWGVLGREGFAVYNVIEPLVGGWVKGDGLRVNKY